MKSFNLEQIPFSRYGTFLSFFIMKELGGRKSGLFLRTAAENASDNQLLRLDLIYNGESIPFSANAVAEVLTLGTDYGNVRICMSGEDAVRIKGSGIGLRISVDDPAADEYVMPEGDGTYQINRLSCRIKFATFALSGKISIDAPWNGRKCEKIAIDFLPDPEGGSFDCVLEAYQSSWFKKKSYPPFEYCVTLAKNEFTDFLSHIPAVPPEYSNARELAAYVDWSCVVPPRGNFRRNSMLMSRDKLIGLWSWDHCFNTMAMREIEKLSFDQLMSVFELQDTFGAIPDGFDSIHQVFNFTKPPIHGWTLLWLMKHTNSITQERLTEIYEPLAKWTQWWFDFRDSDSDGIPHYNHGNDTGWDNSTVFKKNIPVESPDLCAFLVIQMEALAKAASLLGKKCESTAWSQKSKELLNRLLKEFWNGKAFFARDALSHQPIDSDSLLTFIPIILGKRLPNDIFDKLLAGLIKKGRFLTDHGFATERLESPLYEADGYWRGPIWPPTTMIIIDGIREGGYLELAQDLARRFCDMVAKSGMEENFDAISGAGLRAKAFTMTASVFLILASEYLQ